jgi:RNA polymerase subunit RPABC4/transcription elongation factor Spt4
VDDELICPVCGSDDELRGEREDELIHVTCQRCDVSWDRDLTPRCPTCESTDVWSAAEAVWEKARGSQLSIVSVRTVYVCPTCEPDRAERIRDSNVPFPPRDNPAEGMR